MGDTPQLYETPSITKRTETQQANNGDSVYHILEPNSTAGGRDANHLYHELEATKVSYGTNTINYVLCKQLFYTQYCVGGITKMTCLFMVLQIDL